MIKYDLLGEADDIREIEKIIKPYDEFKRDIDADILFAVGGDRIPLEYKDKICEIKTLRIHFRKNNPKSLGFHADVNLKNLPIALRDIIRGDYFTEESNMIDCYINSKYSGTALNEITVQGIERSSCILSDVEIHYKKDNKYKMEKLLAPKCDGVLVCTKYGSTAWNLTLGGPILYSENSLAIDLMTPPIIQAHYVCPIHYRIVIRPEIRPENNAIVTMDIPTKIIGHNDYVEIKKSKKTAEFIRTNNTEEKLTEKLIRQNNHNLEQLKARYKI